jgi:hypothetical protein
MTDQAEGCSPEGAFDLNDGRNVYQPCPSCKKHYGVGLIQRRGRQAIECDCGHRGPEIDIPTLEQWVSWPVPRHERDRLAFDGWNNQ